MLNKKGITSVELLVCFIIISTIVVSMYNLILNYRNREQIEEINNEVVSYANNLQEVIQGDLVMGHLVSVSNVSNNGYKATFTFDTPNNYTTTLTINPNSGVISYGRSGEVINYEIPNIADLMLLRDSKIEYLSGVNGYIKITIILNHPNFTDETYSFMINCPVNYAY